VAIAVTDDKGVVVELDKPDDHVDAIDTAVADDDDDDVDDDFKSIIDRVVVGVSVGVGVGVGIDDE